MEFMEHTLNNRPIGIQTDLEVLTPNCYKPVHSNTNPSIPPGDYSTELANAKERFARDWFELYYCTILKQSKWTDTTADFAPGDLGLITDLGGVLWYPILGRVKSIEKDSDGIDRYYIIEYK